MSDEGDYDIEDFGDQDDFDAAAFDIDAAVEDVVQDTTQLRPELKKLYTQHPECIIDYVETIIPKLEQAVAVPGGEKKDPSHTTYPFLTVYEETKIIGLRASQLSKGSLPFIKVPDYMTDVREIARMELREKRLPFIVKRPLPDGSYEVWRLSDLILLS